MSTGPRERYFVQSLDRGLAVIRALGDARRGETLAEVARATGLTRAAARRFLLTLVDLGYARMDGRLFSLTPQALELGYAYLSSLGLPDIAAPHLQRVVAEVHESSSLGVLDGDEIVYIARAVTTERIMSAAVTVGTRLPAHVTSMGRVLLAALEPDQLEEALRNVKLASVTDKTIVDPVALREELARVREQGYAIDDEELEQGLRSIAVPIHAPDGAIVAAMNISTHSSHSSVDQIRATVLPRLLAAAQAIGRELPTR
jgi:IclR family transcriptional regulator, pca regulon regulatory protein